MGRCFIINSKRNILIVFFLNLFFSLFELMGGLLTGSIAILSDALHDFGDAAGVGISYALEKKSQKKPDEKYTYGYIRYSVLGAAFTNTVLIVGSVIIIYNALLRAVEPAALNYRGMIFFAVVGLITNSAAFFFTRGGSSMNQKAVNLHMAEDILTWAAVLLGAFVIKYTGLTVIDTLLSLGSALFVLITAVMGFKKIIDLFLEKAPDSVSVAMIKERLMEIEGVADVHHIHVRSFDGVVNCATMHLVTKGQDARAVKEQARQALFELGVTHSTLEIEEA